MMIDRDRVRAWCLYLAYLHQATGGTIELPVSYNCPRRPGSMTGCGTCYNCTRETIHRAVVLSTETSAVAVYRVAREINDAVFQYVTALDERLNHSNGLGDDYTEMTSEHYARVMKWAGTIDPITTPVASHMHEEPATVYPPWRPEPDATDTAENPFNPLYQVTAEKTFAAAGWNPAPALTDLTNGISW